MERFDIYEQTIPILESQESGQTHNYQGYQGYLSSKTWQCDCSPSKAHHWIEQETQDGQSVFQCAYCHQTRNFNTEYVTGQIDISSEARYSGSHLVEQYRHNMR